MGKGGQNCDALLLLSALVSIQMARGLTADELGLLAAFFTVLGDNLALLALCPVQNSGTAEENGESKTCPEGG